LTLFKLLPKLSKQRQDYTWELPVAKRLARFGIVFMTVASLGVALYSLRYFAVLADFWPAVDEGIQGVVRRVPIQSLTHMLVAPIALLVGALQFIQPLRVRRPKMHRYLGRIYVVSCVVAGIAGVATALHASGGPVAGWGFGILGVLWVATTIGGWRAAVQRRLELHRVLMRFSYAMTFGAVTLRLQIPIGFALGYASYSEMSVWLAYTAWIPNVLAVAAYSFWRLLRAQSSGAKVTLMRLLPPALPSPRESLSGHSHPTRDRCPSA
jgi:uncharacterized membrane protein